MPAVFSDPVQALTLLPLGQSEALERQWLQDTLAWLKGVPAAPTAKLRTERLRRLAEGILSQTATKERFQQIWVKAFASKVFSEAGLPEATSLPRELIARVKSRLVPQLEDVVDLYSALTVADLDDTDAQWIAGLSDEDIAPWRELMGGSAGGFPVALRLLAVRAAAIGLSPGVMKVMPHRYETESPFYELIDAVAKFTPAAGNPGARGRLQEIVFGCRVSAGLAHGHMEEQGVSSDLVFRLDLVLAQLERIDVLVRVMCHEEDARRFVTMLVRAFAEERSVHNLIRNSVNRLARRIVTHTGQSGEHYIAGSRVEWAKMGYGAVGAGGITAFTALFKYVFAATTLAPLWIGVAHSLNYTVSFVLMQFLGWRLASKMPSMTAAALCDALEKEDGMRAEVDLVAAITRTQCVVTIGNLLGAIPLALLIDALFRTTDGSPFLSRETALHGLESMHLLRSLTIPFAALTGCFLWLSSLFAGWTANWMALNRVPAGIAQSRRIRRFLGDGPALQLAHIVKQHLSGVAGYVCLGLLLGLLPFVSVFAGLPVEVRHITLASASVTYDVSSLAWRGAVPWPAVWWALGGLLVTGLLNFSVSFALGLWLALRARNLGTGGRQKLIVALWDEFRSHPARFLWSHEFAAEPADV
jgi:site-specific recombinase